MEHILKGMQNRSVSPVISVILMVAIVVILAAVLSTFVLDSTESLDDPAPNVADTTGEFDVGVDGFQSDQIVRITHVAGDSVEIDKIEIVVQASGPGSNLPREARLINLPSEGSDIDEKNIDGNLGLIDKGSNPIGGAGPPNLLITAEDSNVWSAGKTIQFRIPTGGADFRDPPDLENNDGEAEELEVVIVHTPSNSILSEHTFTP
jgi:flagellin-like protein